MASQKDVKNRISSVKNIQKITRAMEMVAAARLRRAEQRIEALRPYARAVRRMTARTVEAVENIPNMPLLEEHDEVKRVGLLLITGDRGLAGAFNSQIVRAGNRRAAELKCRGQGGGLVRLGQARRLLARVPRDSTWRWPTRASPTGPRSPTPATSPATSPPSTWTTRSTAWR